MCVEKILLHFSGLMEIFKYYMASVAGMVKAVCLIFLVVATYSLIFNGVGGAIEYVKSIDYRYVLIILITLVGLFVLFSLTSVVLTNFFASVHYCRKQGIKLKQFYALSEHEILNIWGHGGRKCG